MDSKSIGGLLENLCGFREQNTHVVPTRSNVTRMLLQCSIATAFGRSNGYVPRARALDAFQPGAAPRQVLVPRRSRNPLTLMQLFTRFLGFTVVLGALAAQNTVQAQPANDAFANAWTLTGALAFTNGSTVNASKEGGEPNHAGNQGGRSVWFNWTAPKGGQIRVHTIGSEFNTLLAVYTGSAVNALTQIAANNDGPGIGSASLVTFTATPGTTYRIAVDASRFFGNPAGGNYSLAIETLATVDITTPTNNAVVYVGND